MKTYQNVVCQWILLHFSHCLSTDIYRSSKFWFTVRSISVRFPLSPRDGAASTGMRSFPRNIAHQFSVIDERGKRSVLDVIVICDSRHGQHLDVLFAARRRIGKVESHHAALSEYSEFSSFSLVQTTNRTRNYHTMPMPKQRRND